MKNVKLLFWLASRLESDERSQSRKNDFIGTLFSLAIFGLILFFVSLFLMNLLVNFEKTGADFELLVFLLFTAFLIQTFFALSLCIKHFFNNSQNAILSHYPFSHHEIFIARALLVFVEVLTVSLFLFLPLLNVYGIMLDYSMSFFLLIPIITILSTLFSFLISALLSFPLVYVRAFLSDKYLLTLIILASLSALIFVLYMLLLREAVVVTTSISFNISNKMIDAVARLSMAVYPNLLLARMLTLESLAVSLLVFILLIVLASGGLFLLERTLYSKMLIGESAVAHPYYLKKQKNAPKQKGASFLLHEFFQTFRNVDNLFQYFSFLLLMPLLTYLCVSSSASVSYSQIGSKGQPTIALLVIIILGLIVNSFAAQSFSRDGDAYYLLKIRPLSAREVLTYKLLFALIPSTLVNLASCITITATGLIPFLMSLAVFLSSSAFSFGIICLAIYFDLKAPQLKEDYTEKSSQSATFTILIGFGLGLILSLLSIIAAFLVGDGLMALISLLFSAAFAFACFLRLFYRCEQGFQNLHA